MLRMYDCVVNSYLTKGKNMKGFMSPKELSEYLGKTEMTLSRWRDNKEGPSFIKLGGRYHYSSDGVDKWIEKNEVIL